MDRDEMMYPRSILPRVEEALLDTPIVLIHGPRQCGKTTLAKLIAEKHGHRYYTFDDENTLRAAREDPIGFTADLPEHVLLDEVQRVPQLFTSLKAMIDAGRRPGRIIMTGSANVLLLPELSDSLAGRMEIIRLHPLTQSEIERSGSNFLARLFASDPGMNEGRRLGNELIDRVLRGGFPSAIQRASAQRRTRWLQQYVAALTQKDVHDLANVRSLSILPKLLEAAAGQTARMFNVTSLASSFAESRPTIDNYLTQLRQLFLLDEQPAWHRNRLRRLIKTPKLHITDSGLAGALLDVTTEDVKSDRVLLGQLLETFVYQELRRHADWQDASYRLSHFRDKDKLEVDIVIEGPGKSLAAVEVKAGSTVSAQDFRALGRLRDITGKDFRCGALLYDGERTLPFGDKLYAVPIRALWEE
jgi:predicted AAA+ superfamily ATPase